METLGPVAGETGFLIMSDEIHGNTSQQLSPSMACERGLSGRMQHWINKSVFIACEQVKGLYGASHSAVRAVAMGRAGVFCAQLGL